MYSLKGLPFELYIYLGAFVTYCDPILVVCICRLCGTCKPGDDVLPELAATDTVHDAGVPQRHLPLPLRQRQGCQEYPLPAAETLPSPTGGWGNIRATDNMASVSRKGTFRHFS